jgi:acyl dehydratase
MTVDPTAVGARFGAECSWTSTDCLLYALGIGAGTSELAFTTEHGDQQVFPTWAAVLSTLGPQIFEPVGDFDLADMVHGEQGVELHRPLPAAGTVTLEGEITGIWDKGSGAVITSRVRGGDLFTATSSVFVRGQGGWGGDRGPRPSVVVPERRPDHVVSYPTYDGLHLLYRLSGDRNPLHSDPAFARAAGFERPILHGLCTYGITGRALLHTLCGSDPGRFVSMSGRFSRPVLPGDTLTVSMWVDGDQAVFVTERAPGEPVIDQGVCRFVGSGPVSG